MFKSKRFMVAAVLGALALVAGACTLAPATSEPADKVPVIPDSPILGDTGILNVYVTDQPPDEKVTGILVTVKEVQVHIAGNDEDKEDDSSDNQTTEDEDQGGSSWISIPLDEGANTFDLLEVRGIEQYIGAIELAPGKITQVRLVIENVQVEFDDSGEFKDARVPSGELKIAHPFRIIGGEATALVIDFDADKMVTVTGSGSIIVKPVVKLTVKPDKPDRDTEDDKGEEDDEEDEATAGLENTVWKLTSYGDSENLTAVLADSAITIEFVSEDGSMKGNAGCNGYSGGYELDGNVLTVPGPVASTEMFCGEPEGVMDQETVFLSTIQLAESYTIDGDTLTINYGSLALIFEREESEDEGEEKMAAGIENTVWKLKSYGSTENLTVVLDGSEITAEFTGAGTRITGNAGCNSYTGSYELDGDLLTVPGPLASTRKFCGEPEGVMDQETAFLRAIQLAERYAIDGDVLTINYGSLALIFER